MNVKASQLDATQRIHYLYNNYYYDFIPDESIPSGYKFNSDVIEYVISKGADAINSYQTQRFGKVINAGINAVSNFMYSLMRNSAIFLGYVNNQLLDANASLYYWNYECTGIDPNYEFSGEYGPAYGFKFIGLCDEIFTLVLDQNGGFYGSERIGNWTYSTRTTEVINQIAPQYDPNEINIPTNYIRSFSDMRPPYISGISLHFFYYRNNTEHEVIVNDFRNLNISYYPTYLGSQYFIFEFYSTDPSNFDINNITVTDNGSPLTLYPNNNKLINLWRTNQGNISTKGFSLTSISNPVFNLPGYYINQPYQTAVLQNNSLGRDSSGIVSGYGDIYLGTYSTTPTTRPANPDPAPVDVPIPVTEIPSNPEDPIPQTPNPDPVPGIPVNPIPIPLPPFPTIVSGNDDLWGQTVELEGLENSLLPYLGSLAEFDFPSFSDLLTEYTGSIIWVAQIMSLLYNGTPLNILFIVLCLFSLVSILIGAYKLWSSTEPDPVNGGRRYKKPPRPPKGGKRH